MSADPLLPAALDEIDRQNLMEPEALEGLDVIESISTEVAALPASLGQFRSEQDSDHAVLPRDAVVPGDADAPGDAVAPGDAAAREEAAAPPDDGANWPQYARKDFLQNYIPSTDPSDRGAKTIRNRMSKRKNMLRLQLGLSVLVVVINISITIWLWVVHPPTRGTGTLFTGESTDG
jgi:hypothetical protein